jgi:hypothetical protein
MRLMLSAIANYGHDPGSSKMKSPDPGVATMFRSSEFCNLKVRLTPLVLVHNVLEWNAAHRPESAHRIPDR